jgi:hypothetical protein
MEEVDCVDDVYLDVRGDDKSVPERTTQFREGLESRSQKLFRRCRLEELELCCRHAIPPGSSMSNPVFSPTAGERVPPLGATPPSIEGSGFASGRNGSGGSGEAGRSEAATAVAEGVETAGHEAGERGLIPGVEKVGVPGQLPTR